MLWRVFLEQLGKALATPLIQKRRHTPATDLSAAIARVVQRARCPNQLEDPAALATAAPGANKRKRCYLPTDILCAAGVRNISAKVVHVHTALCMLVGGSVNAGPGLLQGLCPRLLQRLSWEL